MNQFSVLGSQFSVGVQDRPVSQMAGRKAKMRKHGRLTARLLVLFILVFFPGTLWSDCMVRSFKGVKPTIPASCYVDESAQIIGDVVLGEHASVWMNAVVRGDVYAIRIGANSSIQDCSVLHGMKNSYGVTVGEYVTVGYSVTLHGCIVEDRCLIGMGSII